MTSKIHWLGAGLSSAPGILRLEESQHPLIVWNRTLDKAQRTLSEYQEGMDIRQLDWQILGHTIQPGDVIVSMLPATKHLEVAEMCLAKKAHFVSSSYISPEMAHLDRLARALGLCLVNEVGLDPGIDQGVPVGGHRVGLDHGHVVDAGVARRVDLQQLFPPPLDLGFCRWIPVSESDQQRSQNQGYYRHQLDQDIQ